LITENAIDLITVYDENIQAEYVNEKITSKIFGEDNLELLKKKPLEFAHPDDVNEIAKIFKKGYQTGKGSGEFRFRNKDGDYIWLEMNGTIFTNEIGEKKALVISRDITKRKISEIKLRESEFQLTERLKELRCLRGLSELCDVSNIKLNELIQRFVVLLISSMQFPKLTNVKIVVDGREFTSDNFMETTYKLVVTSCDISVFVYYSEDEDFLKEEYDLILNSCNQLNRFVEKRKFKHEIEKQNVELKKLSELKSEFLRRASHELKTPLISIKGYANMLQDYLNDDDEMSEMLEEINEGCLRLQDIIESLIKSSKLSSKKVSLNLEQENLSFLIRFCLNELRFLIKKRSHVVHVDIEDDIIVRFDKEQMFEVISNVLSNAIKYTPSGGTIKIKTHVNEKEVILSIKDDGIGFSKEEKKKTFKQFGKIERYGQGLDIDIDGSGLGLYISKNIVKLHGGKIWLESDGKNNGTTVFVLLPLD